MLEFGKIHVLLADDNCQLSGMTAKILTVIGAGSVQVANDLPSCITMLNSNMCNCCILDVWMGESLALPAVKAAKQLGIPGILVSGGPIPEPVQDEVPGWPLYRKPIPVETWREVMGYFAPHLA